MGDHLITFGRPEARSINRADVRAAAQSLVFAMEAGAHGPEIRDRTMRLMRALGDDANEHALAEATLRILSRAVEFGMMPKDVSDAFRVAGRIALSRLFVPLKGSVPLLRLSLPTLRLYVLVLALVRVTESGEIVLGN